MKLYKLTTQDNKTKNDTLWAPEVTHTAKESGDGLCSGSWIHAYSHPLVAMIMNPNHANIRNPKLWLAEGAPGCYDGQLKLGCKSLTTVRELIVPVISLESNVVFAIDIALAVFNDASFAEWANGWKSGGNRSCAAAYAAADAAADAAYAAKYAAADFNLINTLETTAKELGVTWEME